MTESFRSTDGYTITRNPRGEVVVLKPSGDKITGGGPIGASLGEYIDSLVASNDARLGRWRWPENPDYVVYLDRGDALVVSESDPRRSPDRISRRYCEDPAGSLGWGEFAARDYFEAHPERKPWEDANPGEAWKLREPNTYPGVAILTEEMGWLWATGRAVDLTRIADGQRIWPEDAS